MTDIDKFAKEILDIELTEAQVKILKTVAEAAANGREVLIQYPRPAGVRTVRKVMGEYLKKGLN